MYLTIALVVLAPIGARLYRLMTMKRTREQLREQLGKPSAGPRSEGR